PERAACVQRGVELADERANVALDAHTGNAKARKRLDEINAAIASHASELASYDAALKVAGERLRDAQAAEAREQDKANAKALRGEIKTLLAASELADEALAQLVVAGNALKAAIDQINALGFPHPTHMQLLTHGERVCKTVLMQTPWARGFEHIAPGDRRQFSDIIPQWAAMLERAVAEKLGEKAVAA